MAKNKLKAHHCVLHSLESISEVRLVMRVGHGSWVDANSVLHLNF